MRPFKAILAASVALLMTSVSAWSASPKVQEAVLYVSAPAEIVASVASAGPKASFDLPKFLVANSVQATQGGASLSAVLQPVYAPAKGNQPRERLRYQARVPKARPGAPVQLRFRTGGLSWTPAMSLQFSAQQAHLQVQASLTNKAIDLAGAKLQLMSGRVASARESSESFADFSDYQWYADMMADYGRAGELDQGALHVMADLPAPDLPVGSTRQVPLISADVTASRTYRWDTRPAPGGRDLSESPPVQRAQAVYSFANTTGNALPEGKVAVSEGSTAVGDGYLAWTKAGDTAVIAVSSVRGLTVRRREETMPRPQTWDTQHKITLEVESTREDPLTVRLAEHLRNPYDYDSDTEQRPTYEFSLQPDVGKKDVFTWNLPVPAKGKAEVTYSYAEAIDLRPLRFIEIAPDDSPQEHQYLVESDRAAVQAVKDAWQQRIRRIQAGGHITYRLPVPANVMQSDVIVAGANTLRISLASDANGKPGPFKVVADLVAIAGRSVDDTSNYDSYTFDLAPFLGASRVAYVRLDNPSGGEAFFAWVQAYRVPEGFASRGHEYAVGDATAPVASTPAVAAPPPASIGPRRILFSFLPGTPDEESHIYLDRGYRDSQVVPEFQARTTYLDQRVTYSFAIPLDVSGADFIVDAWGGFAVAVAPDAGGAPGEFHEELNSISLLGWTDHQGRSRRQYGVDLTPYLKNSPSRTVYVDIYSADPTTGWAMAAWSRIEVAALDDAEQSHLGYIRRQTDAQMKREHDRSLLNIRANDKGADVPYVYEDHGSQPEPHSRVVEGNAEVTYRLPLKPDYRGARLLVWVLGDSLVSYAIDDHGKPGAFTDLFRARDKRNQSAIETFTNPDHAEIGLTSQMLDSGAIYVRIRDAAPDQPNGSQIHALSIERPIPGS